MLVIAGFSGFVSILPIRVANPASFRPGFSTFYQHPAPATRKPQIATRTADVIQKVRLVPEPDEENKDASAEAENQAGNDTPETDADATKTPDASTETPAPTSDSADVGDELPEEEELTPELVEEEAIRGDFMLRWASIFLALLFGFSQISDTRTLIHVRSGDEMRANGFLPSGKDTLSYAIADEPSANISWLFDHVVSAVYQAGGETGLTLFKAFVAGLVAYLLSLISVTGMPTWWSSICCVLAIGAMSIDFLPVTDLATLVGMVIVLLILHRYTQGQTSGLIWKLPLTIAVWANFDPHAYLGVLTVGLFALGVQLQRSRSANQSDGPAIDASSVWKAAVVSLFALFANPAPVASVLSAATTYGVEYPGMAQMRPLSSSDLLLDGRTEYYSMWVADVWRGFEFGYVSGVSIIVIAVIVLLIGRDRRDLPWATTLLGMALLAVLALHELPVAALVAAVAAGTAGQRWYGRSFRQEYSIDTSEVLFSRGGRAVTVLSFAALGFYAVADQLPTRSPIGMGFEADLKTTMDSLETELAELPDDVQVLHTRMSQGDLLIWHGLQSFVDSRVRPFGRYENPQSAIHRFDVLRWSILGAPEQPAAAAGSPAGAGDPAADSEAAVADGSAATEEAAEDSNSSGRLYDPEWKKTLADLGVGYAMIRLSPPGKPAYTMAQRLFQSPDWVMTNRGPSAMFFAPVRNPAKPPSSVDIVKTAFRTAEADDVKQVEFAREPDFYRTWLYASRPTMNAPLREAQHYLALDSSTPPQVISQIAAAAGTEENNSQYISLLGATLAGPIMAVRNANKAINLDPQNAKAHRLLGQAYVRLNSAESAIAGVFGGANLDNIRYLQAVGAFRQAVTIDQTVPETWEALAGLYQQHGRTGLAADCLEKYLTIIEERATFDAAMEAELRRLYELLRTWNDHRTDAQEQVDEFLAQSMPEDPQQHAQQKMMLVQQLVAQGDAGIALKVLQDNVDLLRPQFPESEVLRGQLLMESGELQAGSDALNQLAAAIREQPQNPAFARVTWHKPVAIAALLEADYINAAETWGEQLKLFADVKRSPELRKALMRSLPLVPDVEAQLGMQVPVWPVLHLQDCNVPVAGIASGEFEPAFLRAITNIESGGVANAKFILEGLITDGGANPLRPLAEVYLQQLSDTASDLIAEADFSPWEDMEFPEATDEESTTDDAKPDEANTDEAAAKEVKSNDATDEAAHDSEKVEATDTKKPEANKPPADDAKASQDEPESAEEKAESKEDAAKEDAKKEE